MTVAIVDHGHANIGSVDNMLRRLGERPLIIQSPRDLRGCDKVVLPGIGAFDAVRRRLSDTGFDDALNDFAMVQGKPILGICVGMQVMTEGSTEGVLPGFKWFSGKCERFVAPAGQDLRVPHMGWSSVEANPQSRLFAGASGEERFYFVHSFRLGQTAANDIAATCDYGSTFVAAVERENIFAVQFHPEKSHKFGMALYRAFLAV